MSFVGAPLGRGKMDSSDSNTLKSVASDVHDETMTYRYVVGAVLVVIVVVALLTLISPIAKYKYLAVAGASVGAGANSALK